MSPDALRRRLAHGNVFAADRVDAALANAFRPATSPHFARWPCAGWPTAPTTSCARRRRRLAAAAARQRRADRRRAHRCARRRPPGAPRRAPRRRTPRFACSACTSPGRTRTAGRRPSSTLNDSCWPRSAAPTGSWSATTSPPHWPASPMPSGRRRSCSARHDAVGGTRCATARSSPGSVAQGIGADLHVVSTDRAPGRRRCNCRASCAAGVPPARRAHRLGRRDHRRAPAVLRCCVHTGRQVNLSTRAAAQPRAGHRRRDVRRPAPRASSPRCSRSG